MMTIFVNLCYDLRWLRNDSERLFFLSNVSGIVIQLLYTIILIGGS